MKVAIITCTTIKYMPYLTLYENILQKKNVEYIIVNDHEEQEIKKNQFVFQKSEGKTVGDKIRRFIEWRKFVKQIIKAEKVERIILLTTWPGVKMVDYWCRQFKNKYILDIRDFTDEDQFIYRKLVDKLIKKSYMTCISSKGFYKWLSKNSKINIFHNYDINKKISEKNSSWDINDIVIGYVGLINYEIPNLLMLQALKNEKNIRLIYKGKIEEACQLKKKCEERKYSHVDFTGPYQNQDKFSLYENIDIINAVYGNDSLVVTSALPNKLYDALVLRKPIVATKGTYLGDIVEKYHLGMALDLKGDIQKQMTDFIKYFDFDKFNKGVQKCFDLIRKEQILTIKKIEKFVS